MTSLHLLLSYQGLASPLEATFTNGLVGQEELVACVTQNWPGVPAPALCVQPAPPGGAHLTLPASQCRLSAQVNLSKL